ncbi:oxidoreductase [Wolfiporia cocos MD-104 SS10]|uniref:Oxidoreductase n=1 Tax=Wolfiporia cocos (strain MD-104) TaxID=742152 RepID=A0A2H3IWC3_WOLCO|nr:oxidoreductase [Wolfiporia cocos MD-104 SS10]
MALPSSDVNLIPADRHDTYPSIDPTKANLAGRVVLITGASRGLGKGTAIAFAKAGVSGLALLARSDMSDVEAACMAAQRPGQALRVLALAADTTNKAQVAAAAERVRETFGRLDVLVNNAGIIESSMKLIGETDSDEWWNVFRVNVLGTYQVTRACLPLLIGCGGDKMVFNLSSIAAHLLGKYNSAYRMTKLAICRFTEQLALEYSPMGLISIAIHPGFVATSMADSMPPGTKHILVDKPELAGDTLVWLAKEKREWLSGRFVNCQWDMDELLLKKDVILSGSLLTVKLKI